MFLWLLCLRVLKCRCITALVTCNINYGKTINSVCVCECVCVCVCKDRVEWSGTSLMAPLNGFLICVLNGDLLWVHLSSTKLNVLPLLPHTTPHPAPHRQADGFISGISSARHDPTWPWQERSTQSERMIGAVKGSAQGGDCLTQVIWEAREPLSLCQTQAADTAQATVSYLQRL